MDFNVIKITLNKIELIEKCYLNDIESHFPRPQWLFWHLPASVFFWGDSLVFFELTNEIADVVKATVNGNIRNRQ